MTRKKLLLVHPGTRSGAAGFAQADAWHMPPLALACVAALTPPDWDVSICDEHVSPIPADLTADLVGITSYTANITRTYELCSDFRAKNIPTVLGGIHVSMCPEEASPYADTVVTGEAEGCWAQVLADFENGCLRPRYDGGRLPLDGLPLPRRDLLPDAYDMDVIQTTRGCPFGCEFCSVTAFNGRAYRLRPVPEVLDEIATLKKDLLYIVDDNILGVGPSSRARALALFKGIVDRGLVRTWVTQTSVNIADDDELLQWAAKSGCRALYIGIESVVPENLKSMRKGFNLDKKDDGMADRIARIHRHGIAVIGSLVLGHDSDTTESVVATLQFMNESCLDVFQLSYLTPFPGTPLADRLKQEGRIIYDSYPEAWDFCDTDHIMIRPQSMGVVELVHGFDYIVRKKLSRHRILYDAIRTLKATRSLTAAVLSYNFNKGSWVSLNPEREICQLNHRLPKQSR